MAPRAQKYTGVYFMFLEQVRPCSRLQSRRRRGVAKKASISSSSRHSYFAASRRKTRTCLR